MDVKVKFFLMTAVLTVALVNQLSLLYNIYSTVGFLVVVLWSSWHFSSYVVPKWVELYTPKINPKNRGVLITGCDTGFGNTLAITLNKLGFKVFAGCQHANSDIAVELKKQAMYPLNFYVVQLDVTNDDDINNAYDEVVRLLDTNEHLWGVVNNAGVATCGELEWADFESHYKRTFDINVFGLVKVTRKFLPLIRESKGRIVNIASVAGTVVFPGWGAYSMSKYAVMAFSEGLRREMKRFGVGVTTILPQPYKTNITDEKTRYSGVWESTEKDVQATYGEKHFQEQVARSTRVHDLLESTKLTEVPNAVVSSLISPCAPAEKLVASFPQRPMLRGLAILPTELLDVFWSLFL